MTKKKKISSFKKDRMKEFIFDLIDNKSYYIDYDITNQDLCNRIINSPDMKTFRHIGKFDFFNTTYNNKPATLIITFLSIDMEKKDSIEINEQIINSIDFLEKVFVSLDNISVCKYNLYDGKHMHAIIIKSLKEKEPREIYEDLSITL